MVIVLALKAAALAPADSGINQKVNKSPPLQRLLVQVLQDLLDLFGGVCFSVRGLDFVLPGLGTVYQFHGIGLYSAVLPGLLEDPLKDGIDLHGGAVALALGLNGQKQRFDLSGGNIRNLQISQGGEDPVVRFP